MNAGQQLAIEAVEFELRWTPLSMRSTRAKLLLVLRAMRRWYK
jgi:hypothetical protein